MLSPYTPAKGEQIGWGTIYDNANCAAWTASMLIDRSSVAAIFVSGVRIRQITGDTSGGLNYTEVAAATSTATSGKVTASVMTSNRAGLKAFSAGGHGLGVSIDCAVTINTPYHTGSFTGGHSIYVNAWRWNATLQRDEFFVLDPGRGTKTNVLAGVWWPAWLLYKAAEARSGGTAIYLLVGRDTEGVTRTASSAGTVWSTTAKTAAKGTFATGKALTVVSTENGGSWTVGTRTGSGWHKVKWGTGYGYVVGGRLN